MAFESVAYANLFKQELDSRLVAREITNNYYIETGKRSVVAYGAQDLTANDKNADSSITWQSTGQASQTTITMNQEKDVSVVVPLVEEFQSNPSVQRKYLERQRRAAEEDINDYVMSLHTSADAGNDIATTASTASGWDDIVSNAKVALSDNNVPRSDRFMILSPVYADLVQKAAGDRMRLNTDMEREGFIGRYQGFDIYETTAYETDAAPSPSKQKLMFGHRAAITLAVEPEEFHLIPNSQMSNFHGAGLKGLVVYGSEVMLPKALGVISADVPE